jgi:cytochrome P450
MPISFWYIAFIINSEKYYKPILDRILSYVLPNATLESENLFNVPSLLADPLLQACFQETLRLRAQNGSMRIVHEATTLPVHGKEHYLRKDSIVFIPAPLIHMDTEIYSNVNEYQPERFLGADLESAQIITGDHGIIEEENKAEKEKKTPKFFKRGVPVKHYMMPFGGGDNLV